MTTTHALTNVFNRTHIAVLALAVIVVPLSMFIGTAHADSDAHAKIGVSIGNDGGVLVRGAKVTGVSSSTITADTSWGSSVLGWIVETDNDTEFIAPKEEHSGVANIAVGDVVSFSGKLDTEHAGFAVDADVVKDWTNAHIATKISGIVTAINSTVGSFTVQSGDSTTTVQTSSSTDFGGVITSFADLVLNAKVKITGFFDATSSVFTAEEVEVKTELRNNDWRHGADIRAWIKSHVSF